MPGTRVAVVAIALALTCASSAAQQLPPLAAPPLPAGPQFPVPAVPQDEAAKVSLGWAKLAQGLSREVALEAEALLAEYPRSAAVLTLAVEASITGRGALTSLDVYERWLGNRTLDEPIVVRRIARGLLYEWARQSTDEAARLEALKALAADGVREAEDALTAGTKAGDVGDRRALASIGNADAVNRTVLALRSADSLKQPEIFVLGESRSPLAVKPLLELLSDSHQEIRAEAADALGKIGDRQALAPLKALLSDPKEKPKGSVAQSAAGALLRFGDFSGIALIQELRDSPYSSIRISAAAMLAAQPDESWKNLVRGLMTDPDPKIRVDAAKMLAPFEPDFAGAALNNLALDPNPAIQMLAGMALSDLSGPVNFPTLRKLLRLGTGRVRVAAANRLLAATR